MRQISLLKKRIDGIREQDEKVPPLPKGLGTEMIRALGVPPSKRLGDLVKALEADVDAGLLEGGQPIEHYIAYLRDNAERFELTLPES